MPVSLYEDAPLTCQFVLEDHAVRHSYHHLMLIRKALRDDDDTDRFSRPSPTPRSKPQQAMWASGDFAVVGTTLQIVGETLCEAVDLRVARASARRGGRQRQRDAGRRAPLRARDVDRLRAGAARARTPPRRGRRVNVGFDVTFEFADAEALPYSSASFDVVLSTFGVMFAPEHRAGRQRDDAGLPPGRTHRPRVVDA